MRDTLNDPVADARLAATVFGDQWERFAELWRTEGDILAFYGYCFEEERREQLSAAGLREVFRALGAPQLTENQAVALLHLEGAGRACATALLPTSSSYLPDPRKRLVVAYALRRFIPAHAGNTRRIKALQYQPLGSSPCMRGTHGVHGFGELSGRFIPAHAGNTVESGLPHSVKAVHPRACGEHADKKIPVYLLHRFIPAHAGNTALERPR